MTIRWLTAGVAAALIVCSPSFAQDKASQKFLKEAIEGNLAEVKMGELAQKNGKSDKVRSFGQMLQKDHSDANQKATAAANQLGMSPPTEPNRKQKAMYDRMSKLSGDNFDREFAKHMVEDHKKDIKAYEKEAKKNDAAAAYAKEALPPCTSIWRRRSHSAARLRAQDPEASCWQTRLEQRRIDVS